MPKTLLAITAFVVLALVAMFDQAGAAIASVQSDAAPLPSSVMRTLRVLGVPSDHVSVYVRDAGSDKVLIAAEAETPRSPASIIKVLTTFAALDMLGPGYTWKTRALIDGTLVDGVLDGNLVLVGGGDPYITSERWWSFVRRLREQGLDTVTGDVIIDNTYFAPSLETRADFDGQAFRSYNVLPDALMVNFQTSRFTISANPGLAKPQIILYPRPSNFELSNQVRLGAGRCQGYNRGVSFGMPDIANPNTVIVGGQFPASCGRFSISRAIMTAPDYAYGTFHSLWTEAGGVIEGGLRLGVAPTDARLLYEYESPALPEIIRLVNKYSNNVMARHLFLTLGAETFGAPATQENGRIALRGWLMERGIDMPSLVLDNGSGLSRAERITARGLGEMLDVAWHSPFMPEFASSLPLSATDGTLRKRFDSQGMQGRLRLKTGSLDDVSALAGYVNAASGKTYVVVIMVNHPGAHRGSGEAIQEELIRWVFAQ